MILLNLLVIIIIIFIVLHLLGVKIKVTTEIIEQPLNKKIFFLKNKFRCDEEDVRCNRWVAKSDNKINLAPTDNIEKSIPFLLEGVPQKSNQYYLKYVGDENSNLYLNHDLESKFIQVILKNEKNPYMIMPIKDTEYYYIKNMNKNKWYQLYMGFRENNASYFPIQSPIELVNPHYASPKVF